MDLPVVGYTSRVGKWNKLEADSIAVLFESCWVLSNITNCVAAITDKCEFLKGAVQTEQLLKVLPIHRRSRFCIL
jgi:hypothetical protein